MTGQTARSEMPMRVQVRADRRVLAAGIAVSVIVHVCVLAFSIDVPTHGSAAGDVTPERAAFVSSGLRVLDLVAVDDDVAPTTSVVRDVRDDVPLPTAVRSSAMPALDASAQPAPSERSALPDARVLGRTTPPANAAALARVHARIAEQLEPFNDSLRAASVSEQRAHDWTRVDENGNHWGVSRSKIHLGSVTLRLQKDTMQSLFRAPADRRDDYHNRMRVFTEIQQQAARVEVAKTINDRVRALNERRTARRDSSGTSPS